MPERAIDRLSGLLTQTTADQIPSATLLRAADCALDAIGSALAGRNAHSVQAMQAVICAEMQAGQSQIWFSGKNSNPIGAATINAMAATALDVDDGHRMAAGHPGAAIIAAASAVANQTGASFGDYLVAIVVAYEAAVRVAVARNPDHHTSTVSGRWSGVGAAVAMAKLQNLSASVMAQAILIAEQQAPRLSSAMHHGFAGSDVKEGIAWSVHSGMFAVELAKSGFRGYPDTFEQGILYDPAMLVANLGDFAAISGLFFKPYACCRWIHSAIDALLLLIKERNLTPDQIDDVEVATFEKAVNLGNHVAPKTEAEAQFSIPFCLSAIAIHGANCLTPIDTALLGDKRIVEFAHKVRITFDPAMQAMFPAKAPAIVRLKFSGHVCAKTVDAAFGDPTNPMSRTDLHQKFKTLAKPRLGSDRISQIMMHFGTTSAAPEHSAQEVLDLIAMP